ncbi:metal ABC transporter ATP-binding protein [Paralimibaculum aggregatum]|uniref:Metal ABC transporter ATP-binding protein n=1 Tax=Paralimibaculum aggregatum TaxID=3036245 RepID=A0ABQ6LG42_9RHOB|nr:metal ABC transporter ATP-binding protein [Limibaculum sp. NKW23]GMG81386.1 metal ABC transporter ATP-binding protein [Limibaculum sp. NKW23]
MPPSPNPAAAAEIHLHAPPSTDPPAAEALIRLAGVTVALGGRPVLHGVDLAVAPGEILTVLGPNGSGKSTLLRTLIGAVRPARGTVWRRPGLRLGYVPQRLAIDATMPLTVDRFLSLPVRRPRADKAAALAEVGLGALGRRQLTELSGGQFQRVLLARALLGRPEVLLLDEPTQALDQPGTAQFYRLIADIRARLGCAVVMVSHDLHVVMSASDRVICVNGHICCEGTPAVVSSAPEYRALFGLGTAGALALYRHAHDHGHDHAHDHGHDHTHDHAHDHAREAPRSRAAAPEETP